MQKKNFNIWMISSIILFCCILFFISPVFTIKAVEVTGNKLLTQSQILNKVKIEQKNIFGITARSLNKKFNKNPYVSNIEVTKKFPDRITLHVIERKPAGYVKYLDNSYLYIDEEGIVLEVVPTFKDRLPVIVGLDFKEFTVGKVLETSGVYPFEMIVKLANFINKYDVSDEMVTVNVSDINHIHVQIYHIDFDIGDISDANQKVLEIMAIIEQIPNYKEIKATVDLATGILQILT